MNFYPEPVLRLIQSFSKLPGIGKKTAERLTLHILHSSEKDARELGNHILELKKSVHLCSVCFSLSDRDICKICSDPSRRADTICVVESPGDIASIENSGVFRGVYHILGGALSPIDGIGPDELRIKELFNRIESGRIKELIIATGTDVEGESTASYIYDRLKNKNISITRIASGIPIGGDLKYVDRMTMQKALQGRYGFKKD
ncbi:MAG: recombination mediator RecR [Desulfobacteraceae bacterium]